MIRLRGRKGGSEPDDINLAPLIAEPRRFSRIFRGKGELIDHILVSSELLPRIAGTRRLPLLVDSLVDAVDRLPSIEEDPRGRARAVAPDHAPVVASFDL